MQGRKLCVRVISVFGKAQEIVNRNIIKPGQLYQASMVDFFIIVILITAQCGCGDSGLP